MSNKNKKLGFQKLTPTDTKDMQGYTEAFDFIFSKSDLLNIAVTGPYGSGKSSVIQTYEKHNKDKRFIYVSLAEFSDQLDVDELNKENTLENDHVKEHKNPKPPKKEVKASPNLEGKILNQIIHQINPKDIPQTEFKTRVDISKLKVNLISFLTSLLLILGLYIFKFSRWKKVVFSLDQEGSFYKGLQFTTNHMALIIAIVISITIVIFLFTMVIKNMLHGNLFKKVKWNNNEIELFDKKHDSYFDKYLDEILYLFKRSDIQTIVFEDIDRYNKNNIFGRLREINFLVNVRYSDKNNNKPIRFFYLLKDDMFVSKERTKFFDFILPIVPIMDNSNSYNQFINIFKAGGILDDFDPTFLERLCLYVDDMRILKNIYNEYIIYNIRIEGSKTQMESGMVLNPNKLLALIVYKNIFPEDFSLLQYRHGFVFHLFENSKILVDQKTTEIEQQIQENKKNISTIKNESLNDVHELDALMVPINNAFMINGKHSHQFPIRTDFIKAIKENDFLGKVRDERFMNHINEVNIKESFDKLSESEAYQRRKDLILKKEQQAIHNLEKERTILESDHQKLHSLRLHELLSNKNIDQYFNSTSHNERHYEPWVEAVLSSPYLNLIKYLIRNAYIDKETYQDYMTYFIENSITRTDKIFLISIMDENSMDYLYKLDSPSMIVDKLKAYDFKKDEILNYDLLDYLLNHQSLERNKNYLDNFLKKIQNDELFHFLFKYLERTAYDSKLIIRLNKKWITLFQDVLLSTSVNSIQKKTYILNTINHSNLANIQEMNINSVLKNYISSERNFLKIEAPDVLGITKVLFALDVSFIEIDYHSANIDLFEAVYQNNLYELNMFMLRLLMRVKYKITDDSMIKKKGYTILLSKPDEPLKKNVDNNIDSFFNLLLEDTNHLFIDNEEAAIEVINHENLDNSYVGKYIDRLDTNIQHIINVKDTDLWQRLLKNNIIDYHLTNIMHYFNEYEEMDNALLQFINEHTNDLSFDTIELKGKFSEETYMHFLYTVIEKKGILKGKYREIIRIFGFQHDNIDFEIIESDRFEIIIEEDLIKMNEDNLIYIRQNFPKLVHLFIVRNISTYRDLFNNLQEVTKDEWLNILKDDQVRESDKLHLLSTIDHEISLFSHNYSEKIMLSIIDNNFLLSDLGLLTLKYMMYPTGIKTKIVEKCLNNLDEIRNDSFTIDKQLLDVLINHNDIDHSLKKTLLVNNLGIISLDKMKEYLPLSGLEDFSRLFNGKRPKIPIEEENKALLDHFKEQDWISSYDKNPGNQKQYIAIGRNV